MFGIVLFLSGIICGILLEFMFDFLKKGDD